MARPPKAGPSPTRVDPHCKCLRIYIKVSKKRNPQRLPFRYSDMSPHNIHRLIRATDALTQEPTAIPITHGKAGNPS